MKLRPLLLTFSLVANAALAFCVVNRTTHWIDFSSGNSATSAATLAADAARARASAADAHKVDQHTWADVTRGELTDVVARLRAEGFPPALQRAIVAAMVTEKFAAQHKELAALIATQPWWVQLQGSPIGGKVIAMRQKIFHDEKDMVEQLLGPDPGSEYAKARRPRQYGDLSVAKATEMDRIGSDYGELMQEVRNAAQNIMLPEDREKLAFLEKERRADIAKLLTPDELLEYDLRSSPTSGTLRAQLTAFNPTEDEFRALFKIQQQFDAQYPSPDLMTPDQRRQHDEAQAKVIDEARAVLAPDRFAEYQQKTDPAYIQTSALMARLQLADSMTSDVVAVQKDIMQRANALRTDRSIAADQRAVQLGALGAEGAVRVGAIIGETNLPAYRQTAGRWLNGLRPPTPGPKN